MLRRVRNSLFFTFASLITAVATLIAFVMIFIKEEIGFSKRSSNQSVAFLASQRRAVAFYQVFSKVYDLVNIHFYSDSMRHEAVELAKISEDSRVLDVGCGTGYTTQAVLNKLSTGEAVGIDLTPQQLKRANKNLEAEKNEVSLFRGDVENLPFNSETFDAVVSVGAVEYFPDPRRAFQEMARVAKNGSRVVVGGPASGWFKKVRLDKVFYTLSAKEAEAFFTQAGLEDVKSFLMGVDTFFGTSTYVMIVLGTKKD